MILGCIVAGMMAVDMGGPFNKAAYVFGTAAITTGGFDIMAAVMIGGMVPPIAIALCATFFKKKFTEKERQSGIVNGKLHHGAVLHYRRCDPICCSGSSQSYTVMHSRISSGRRTFHGIWMYSSSTSWRDFRIPGSWKCIVLCDGTGSRCISRHDPAGSFEKEYRNTGKRRKVRWYQRR